MRITTPWTANRSHTIRRVFIIESNSPRDIYDSHREGRILSELLGLLDIRTEYHTCVNRKQLARAFRDVSRRPNDAVHVSCHGDTLGIALTDGVQIDWEEFVELAGPALDRKLLVVSACNSGDQELARQFKNARHRPGIIVGTCDDIDWSDAAIAWQLLYKWLNGGSDIVAALNRTSEALDISLVYRRWCRSRYRRKFAPEA